MPASDPLDILLAHDLWASQQILLVCQKLSPEQFSRKFDIGPGSLQTTLTHMIAAIDAWCDTLAQTPPRPRIDETGIQYSATQLLRMLDLSSRSLANLARALPLSATVKRTRQGKEYTFTRGVVVTHITTHGMHHRAQCLNMLKHLGITPLPPSSVVEWSRALNSQT